MATDDERDRAFRRERTRTQRRLTRIQRDTAAEVTRILEEARREIDRRLARVTTEAGALFLARQRRAVADALARAGERSGARTAAGAGAAWEAGVAATDAPIEAGLALDRPGVRMTALLPDLDDRQLFAMRAFLTAKMKEITLAAANRVNVELGAVAAGAVPHAEAATRIARILRQGGRGRAITVIRTELGRAFALAAQERQEQASALLPGLRKQWRRSGKIHSRPDHDAADGQVREVTEPFIVGGVRLRFPRDPAAPAHATVNCGCASLPYMDTWEVREPGRRPFTREELNRSPIKRTLESGLKTAEG